MGTQLPDTCASLHHGKFSFLFHEMICGVDVLAYISGERHQYGVSDIHSVWPCKYTCVTYNDITWASWHLKSLATWLFCSTASGQQQRNITGLHYWPFVRGIHWWPVDSPHKGSVMWKLFPCHDAIMWLALGRGKGAIISDLFDVTLTVSDLTSKLLYLLCVSQCC